MSAQQTESKLSAFKLGFEYDMTWHQARKLIKIRTIK